MQKKPVASHVLSVAILFHVATSSTLAYGGICDGNNHQGLSQQCAGPNEPAGPGGVSEGGCCEGICGQPVQGGKFYVCCTPAGQPAQPYGQQAYTSGPAAGQCYAAAPTGVDCTNPPLLNQNCCSGMVDNSGNCTCQPNGTIAQTFSQCCSGTGFVNGNHTVTCDPSPTGTQVTTPPGKDPCGADSESVATNLCQLPQTVQNCDNGSTRNTGDCRGNEHPCCQGLVCSNNDNNCDAPPACVGLNAACSDMFSGGGGCCTDAGPNLNPNLNNVQLACSVTQSGAGTCQPATTTTTGCVWGGFDPTMNSLLDPHGSCPLGQECVCLYSPESKMCSVGSTQNTVCRRPNYAECCSLPEVSCSPGTICAGGVIDEPDAPKTTYCKARFSGSWDPKANWCCVPENGAAFGISAPYTWCDLSATQNNCCDGVCSPNAQGVPTCDGQ